MTTRRESSIRREIRQTRPFRSAGQEAVIAILRTGDEVRHRLTTVIEPSGVTLQQYNVLRILRGAHPDPLPAHEIGQRLIERTPGTTRLLDRLEEKSLVRRQRGAADRRLVHCWITDAGLGLLAALDPSVDDVDRAIVHRLGATEIDELIRLLDLLRQGARDG